MPETIHPGWLRDAMTAAPLERLRAKAKASRFTPAEDAMIAAAFLWCRNRTTDDPEIRRMRRMLIACGQEWAAHEGPRDIVARVLAGRTRHDPSEIAKRWRIIGWKYLPPSR